MSDEGATEEHAGTQVGIASTGAYSIDTSAAESSGDIQLRLKPDSTVSISFGDGPAMRIESIGGWIRIELGGGASERLVLGDQLLAALNQFFQQKFDAHTHPTPAGASGPPLPAFAGTQLTDDVLSDIAFTKKS
jgi:hypothetical protein